MPFANIRVPKIQMFARAAALRASTETRPTITVSTKPSIIVDSWVAATGTPSTAILRISWRSAAIDPPWATPRGVTTRRRVASIHST